MKNNNKNNQLFLEYFDQYDDKFSIKKKLLYRNKNRLALKFHKNKIRKLYNIWYDLPFSLLIFANNLKYYHKMINYFYTLKDFVIIKKHRRIYKTDIVNKNITGFNCYRIYCNNFLTLYDNMEEILEYQVNILGIEMHAKLYSIQQISIFLKTIKDDLKYFFNILNDFNEPFNKTFNYFQQVDSEFNQNLQEIFLICQHITKSDAEKE